MRGPGSRPEDTELPERMWAAWIDELGPPERIHWASYRFHRTA